MKKMFGPPKKKLKSRSWYHEGVCLVCSFCQSLLFLGLLIISEIIFLNLLNSRLLVWIFIFFVWPRFQYFQFLNQQSMFKKSASWNSPHKFISHSLFFLGRQSNGTIPMWKKGEKTIKQPVFVIATYFKKILYYYSINYITFMVSTLYPSCGFDPLLAVKYTTCHTTSTNSLGRYGLKEKIVGKNVMVIRMCNSWKFVRLKL